jgi:hypothetical protein
MPAELRALFERYCQLGRQLPDDIETLADPHTRAEAQIILAEMAKTKRRIDNFLAAARSSAAPARPQE